MDKLFWLHHSLTVSPLAFWSEKRVVHSFIRSWCNFCFVFMRDTPEYLLGELRESCDSSYTIQETFSQKYDIMIRYLWLRIYAYPGFFAVPVCISLYRWHDGYKIWRKIWKCVKAFRPCWAQWFNYFNGHCFVSLMFCVPVWNHAKLSYLAVLLGYRMWQKKNPSWNL